MSVYRPPDCSEREPDGVWEDCTWASGIMFGNAIHGRSVYPSTQREYEALRKASGDTMDGGSNLTDLRKGMLSRWGWTGSLPSRPSFANLWAALKPGVGAVVQGSMGSVPVHFRRWDLAFGANGKLAPHAVYAQREDSQDRVWWMNPQAPKGYAGEWMSKKDLESYYGGFAGQVTIGKIGSRQVPLPDTSTEENELITTITTLPHGGKYVIPAGARVVGIKFDPVSGKVSATKEWEPRTVPSSASYDAEVVTTAVRGNPFIRAIDGAFAGFLISKGQVQATPKPAPVPPATDCTPAANAAVSAVLDKLVAPARALSIAIEEARPR